MMRYLPTGAQMKEGDQKTICDMGMPSMVLMERAALAVVEEIKKAQLDLKKVLVVCGSGNNGGDGFAVARLLHLQGHAVEVWSVGKQSSMTAETRLQMEIARNYGVPVKDAVPEADHTVIVDAIFGIGLSRQVSGSYYNVIDSVNRMKGKKVAVDIPSGISADTGEEMGIAVAADLTVTFAFEKIGMLFGKARTFVGKLVTVPIGIEPPVYGGRKDICYTYDRPDLKTLLPKRDPNGHKGTFGKVLLIMGSPGMAGAAYFSARAAYLAGAGLVQIYTAKENQTSLQQLLPEAIVTTYDAYEEAKLKELLAWADVIGIGSGLSVGKTAQCMLSCTLRNANKPCVIDADGLNLLAKDQELFSSLTADCVLTPHLKEMSGICGHSIKELKTDRFRCFQEFTETTPSVCVMKDARTLVGKKGCPVYVNTSGNQAMAKGGAGDVLGGVIAGLLAQGMKPYEAGVLGVFLHGLAGDDAQRRKGSYSVLASDILEGIAEVLGEESREAVF